MKKQIFILLLGALFVQPVAVQAFSLSSLGDFAKQNPWTILGSCAAVLALGYTWYRMAQKRPVPLVQPVMSTDQTSANIRCELVESVTLDGQKSTLYTVDIIDTRLNDRVLDALGLSSDSALRREIAQLVEEHLCIFRQESLRHNTTTSKDLQAPCNLNIMVVFKSHSGAWVTDVLLVEIHGKKITVGSYRNAEPIEGLSMKFPKWKEKQFRAERLTDE